MQIDFPKAQQIPLLRALWQEAFGDDDAFLDRFFAIAYSPRRCRCVTQGDALAAALYWFDCSTKAGKYAYLYAVATANAYRNRGLCRRLMEDTHRLLAESGYQGAVLVPASPALTAMYAGMGYVPLSGMDSLSATAGDKPVPVQQIDANRYSALRRTYLGTGGLVQEGASLDFLSGWASFYEGEDFLLAASRKDSALQGLELLGSTRNLSGILSALGATSGTFRVPGATPFAMFLPFTEAPAPTYFGLAFD